MGNVTTAAELAEKFQDKNHDDLNGSHLRTGDEEFPPLPGQLGDKSLIMNSTVEKVPDKGWKNVFIKGLKVASSWGRAVSEDHDPSTLPGQLKMFSLDEGKSQTRTTPKRTHDLKVTSNLEAVSSKVLMKKDNARQAVKARATEPVDNQQLAIPSFVGGPKPIREGGAADGSPPRKITPLFKGTKVPQSKASAVTTSFLQIRSGGEFISPAKHVPEDSTQGIGSTVHGADNQPTISIRRNSPMSERQAPGIGKTRRGDDQSVKMDGVLSSSSWDMDTGPPCTDAWDNLVEGWDSHHFSDGKWVPLPDRKLAKVSGSVDALGQMGVTGSRLFLSGGSPQNVRAQSEYTNDDGWETVPKRKKAFPGNKNPPTLQTGKVRLNKAMLQDSSGISTRRSRIVEDFEPMGKRLGGGSQLPGSHEEFGNPRKEYSISRESHKDHSSTSYMDILRGRGSLSVSPGRQLHFPNSSDSVYSIKTRERVFLRDTDGMSRVGTSNTEINAENMNMAFRNLIREQSKERVEKKGGSLSDDGEHVLVSSESDSQFHDMDNGEDFDDYAIDDEDDCESGESEKSHDTKKKAYWCRSFFQDLDFLSYEQIQDYERQWHCPVCLGGVGAIDWYRGLGPLVTHAKTMRKRRMKYHLAFADLLEEEIHLRGVQANSGARFFGKREGLQSENGEANQLILWPPMVVIQNTMLDFDDDSKTTVEKERGISKTIQGTLQDTVFVISRNLQHREQELKILQQGAEEQLITNKQQLNGLADFYRLERFQLGEEILRKEKEIEKMREDYEESHRQLCQKLRTEQSEIQNQVGLSNGEQQHQQALMENAISKEAEFVEASLNNAQEYEAEHMKLQEKHHQLRLQFQRKQHQAAIALEKQLKAEVELLMTTYQDKWLPRNLLSE